MDGITNAKFGKSQDLYVSDSYHVVMEGDYGGRHFAILCVYGHPCAYIEVRKDDAIAKCEGHRCDGYCCDCASICVHGGPTYYGSAQWDETDQRNYIGWDYAHLGDYCNYGDGIHIDCIDKESDKHWTTAEILMDVALAGYGLDTQKEIIYCG